jgi:hypothetical protein
MPRSCAGGNRATHEGACRRSLRSRRTRVLARGSLRLRCSPAQRLAGPEHSGAQWHAGACGDDSRSCPPRAESDWATPRALLRPARARTVAARGIVCASTLRSIVDATEGRKCSWLTNYRSWPSPGPSIIRASRSVLAHPCAALRAETAASARRLAAALVCRSSAQSSCSSGAGLARLVKQAVRAVSQGSAGASSQPRTDSR